jgi:hypothetical protein
MRWCNTNPNSDSYGDRNRDSNGNGYSDRNGNSDSYCDCYRDAYAYGNSDGDPASANAKAAAHAVPSADSVRDRRVISIS